MTLSILFWVCYVVVLLFGGWSSYAPGNFRPLGGFGAVMLLIAILGWGVFGAIVKQ